MQRHPEVAELGQSPCISHTKAFVCRFSIPKWSSPHFCTKLHYLLFLKVLFDCLKSYDLEIIWRLPATSLRAHRSGEDIVTMNVRGESVGQSNVMGAHSGDSESVVRRGPTAGGGSCGQSPRLGSDGSQAHRNLSLHSSSLWGKMLSEPPKTIPLSQMR